MSAQWLGYKLGQQGDNETKIVVSTALMSSLRDLSVLIDRVDNKMNRLFKEQVKTKVVISQINVTLNEQLEDINELKFPIKNINELEKFEKQLKTNESLRTKLFIHLQKNCKTITRMVEIFDDFLLIQFNISGANSKRCFAALEIYDIMRNALESESINSLVANEIKKAQQRCKYKVKPVD